jgi:hypothetical protein
MITNKSVQRMASQPGYPDLRVPDFVIPNLPYDVIARFPSLEIWEQQLSEAHKEWRASLQRSIETTLQSLKPPP